MRFLCVVLMAVTVALSGVGLATAQVDLAKALVGKWEGEQEMLVDRSAIQLGMASTRRRQTRSVCWTHI